MLQNKKDNLIAKTGLLLFRFLWLDWIHRKVIIPWAATLQLVNMSINLFEVNTFLFSAQEDGRSFTFPNPLRGGLELRR